MIIDLNSAVVVVVVLVHLLFGLCGVTSYLEPALTHFLSTQSQFDAIWRAVIRVGGGIGQIEQRKERWERQMYLDFRLNKDIAWRLGEWMNEWMRWATRKKGFCLRRVCEIYI